MQATPNFIIDFLGVTSIKVHAGSAYTDHDQVGHAQLYNLLSGNSQV